jgi:hypothetical protein
MEVAMIVDRPLLVLTSLPLLWLASIVSADARSVPSTTHEMRLGRCIRQATSGRTWLERTLWGLRDQEAGWIGAEVANTNGTHDLGPLQVNSSWVPKLSALVDRQPALVRTWLINDPCFNVQAARWIFLSGLGMTGDYWKAIGVYHSPTAWRQAKYIGGVSAKLRRRYGPAIFQ